MKIFHSLIAIPMLFLLSFTVEAMPNSFADLVDQQRQTVVNISTTKTVRVQPKLPGGHSPFDQFYKDYFGQAPERKSNALGTGFIVSKKGYVVTNNHVIDGADEIIVKTSDGKEFEAELIGSDAKLDVALLKIKAKGLKAVTLADSDKLRVGDWVVAIGNPFGLEQTVTAGIVSARSRVIGSGPYDDFIQTDAAINPGNSGGPLFNTKGEVVGINTAIYSRSGGNNGIGFAIPINLAHSVFDELRKTGHVQRARLGVIIRDVSPEMMQDLGLKDRHGTLVSQVQSGSAADKAGIEAGDVIVGIDQDKIKSSHDLPIRVARHHPGDKVVMHLMRNGKKKAITVVVEAMPDSASESAIKKHAKLGLGLALSELKSDAREQLQVLVKHGLVVQQVLARSPAARAGILRGDVLFKVNGQLMRKMSDLRAIVDAAEPGDTLRIMMDRHGDKAFTVIRLAKDKGK
ncbi:MAG: DegQ family serine endoprotease [Mariprofundaceae bacterium]